MSESNPGRSALSRRALLAVALAAAALTLGAALAYLNAKPSAPDIPGLLWPNPKPLSDFELRDQAGRPFDLARLEGAWTLLFFGYTHCPDVCPMTLSVLDDVDDLLAQAGRDPSNLQYVFVSVDPERDSLEHLGDYVTYFDEDFLGVTGDDAALKELTRQLGALYVRSEPDENGDYVVDHTAAVFLIDPRARLIALFQAPHDARVIARDLPRIQALGAG